MKADSKSNANTYVYKRTVSERTRVMVSQVGAQLLDFFNMLLITSKHKEKVNLVAKLFVRMFIFAPLRAVCFAEKLPYNSIC